jgi:hypothetical protein
MINAINAITPSEGTSLNRRVLGVWRMLLGKLMFELFILLFPFLVLAFFGFSP